MCIKQKSKLFCNFDFFVLQSSKDIDRMDSLVYMIDTWSSVYSLLVGLVGVAQVLLLKSFFNIRPPTSNLRMST
jgi:hypothetical protein